MSGLTKLKLSFILAQFHSIFLSLGLNKPAS
jgi:hypothetical protein